MKAPERTSRPSRKPFWLAAVCFIALTAALPVFVVYGQAHSGAAGRQSAFVAYGVCLGAAWTALAVAGFLNTPQLAIAGVLASMIFRMGAPLAAIVVFQVNNHPLLEAGVDGMIMAYYLLMLAVEAPLSMLLVRPNPTPTGAS